MDYPCLEFVGFRSSDDRLSGFFVKCEYITNNHMELFCLTVYSSRGFNEVFKGLINCTVMVKKNI